MSTPVTQRMVAYVEWLDRHVKPLIASLASQGKLDGVEALQLLDSHDRTVAAIKFMDTHSAAIRDAAR